MRIAVLTSGGDAPGMNPALRAAVRQALSRGADVLSVHEGYAGLVEGGERLRPCGWDDVSNVLQRGGTVFGTARCPAFRTEDGRRRAVANLLARGVSRLVVIGGDGSLTGCTVLRREWSEHVAALVDDGTVAEEVAAAHPALQAVGLVGSIDNDMWGTDRTIGCDSALHRIVDAVDTLTATARSHQRAFVVEVMGRRCGYLALAAAVCTDADHVLLPEAPSDDWEEAVVQAIRARPGRRKRIVILAEGAATPAGEPIEAAAVQRVLAERLNLEARTTVLGHVQRGGAPSAYDRVMSTALGARAVDELMAMESGDEPLLLATRGEAVVARPLGACVARSHEVGQAIDEGRFADAVAARGEEFTSLLPLVRRLATSLPDRPERYQGKRVLLAHVGAPAPGMNAAVLAFARRVASDGGVPWIAPEGLRGLVAGEARPLEERELHGVSGLGSTQWGTNRWAVGDAQREAQVAAALSDAGIEGLVLVGGFGALASAEALDTVGCPVAVVPATISNNVPGTELSVGCDTAVNAIVEAMDRLKLSALGSRDRVFVVEVMGRRCGYLATAAGIGGGAELVYTHEDGLDLARLTADAGRLNEAFDHGRTVGLVLLADGVTDTWDSRALARILDAESGDRYDTRVCVLGHLQQGGGPSPQDRLTAVRLADAAAGHALHGEGVRVAGLAGTSVVLRAIDQVMAAADRAHRRPAMPRQAALVSLAPAMMLPGAVRERARRR